MKAKLSSSLPKGGVIISGAHGMGNIGDEAALAGIISDLRSIDPSMPICVLSRSPSETAEKLGVYSIHSFNIPAIHRALRSCSLFISGGGSLIQDVSSTRSLLYYLFCLRLAKSRGCPIMIYGCGIGPVLRKRNRKTAAKTINRCVDAITLRDEDSLEELRALGVSVPETHCAVDPALFTGEMAGTEIDALMHSCGLTPGEKYICFCLRNWRGFSKLAPEFARAADYAWSRHGLKSVFLSMNPGEDTAFARSIATLCSHTPLILEKNLSVQEASGLISRMNVLVGMRLHALVFAAKNSVPTVGISYDPKVAAFLKYIGRSNYVEGRLFDAQELEKMIDAAAAALPGTNESCLEKIEKLRHLSPSIAEKLLQSK